MRVDRWGRAETLLHLSLLPYEGGKGGAETGVSFASMQVDFKKINYVLFNYSISNNRLNNTTAKNIYIYNKMHFRV